MIFALFYATYHALTRRLNLKRFERQPGSTH
jgi:hypothetical protein